MKAGQLEIFKHTLWSLNALPLFCRSSLTECGRRGDSEDVSSYLSSAARFEQAIRSVGAALPCPVVCAKDVGQPPCGDQDDAPPGPHFGQGSDTPVPVPVPVPDLLGDGDGTSVTVPDLPGTGTPRPRFPSGVRALIILGSGPGPDAIVAPGPSPRQPVALALW